MIYHTLRKNSLINEALDLLMSQEMIDSAHDFSHFERVLTSVYQIANIEGGNLEVLTLATLLHDIKNFPKGDPRSKKSSELSAEFAKNWLQERNYDKAKIAIVYDAILNHSFSYGGVPQTLEGKILQDADRQDALGAIGLARLFAVAGSRKTPLYSREDPLAKKRSPNDAHYAIDHIFCKLEKLPALMNTATGKKLAEQRMDFVRAFLDQLHQETTTEINFS